MKTIGFVAAIAAACLLSIGGCAQLAALGTADSSAQLIVKTAVEFGTGKAIEKAGADASSRAAKATQIKSIAADLEGIVSKGDTTSITALETTITGLVASKGMSPAEAQLIDNVVTGINAELLPKVQNGVVGQVVALQVNTVLGWVIEAANGYIPKT